MFDYIDLSEDKITQLEESEIGAIILSGLMMTHGFRKGILTAEALMPAIHNTFAALFNKGLDEGLFEEEEL